MKGNDHKLIDHDMHLLTAEWLYIYALIKMTFEWYMSTFLIMFVILLGYSEVWTIEHTDNLIRLFFASEVVKYWMSIREVMHSTLKYIWTKNWGPAWMYSIFRDGIQMNIIHLYTELQESFYVYLFYSIFIFEGGKDLW